MKNWLKRMGWAGLLFFTLKGIAWLVLPAVLVTMGIECN